MSKLFAKLNLKDQKAIVVLNRPDSFKKELAALKGVKIADSLGAKADFVLAFVTRQAEVDKLSQALAKKAEGDAVVWFAYPKGTSKNFSCDFNRDTGWAVLKNAGFDTVRQVAIDEDWTALRFRRVEFIKAR